MSSPTSTSQQSNQRPKCQQEKHVLRRPRKHLILTCSHEKRGSFWASATTSWWSKNQICSTAYRQTSTPTKSTWTTSNNWRVSLVICRKSFLKHPQRARLFIILKAALCISIPARCLSPGRSSHIYRRRALCIADIKLWARAARRSTRWKTSPC